MDDLPDDIVDAIFDKIGTCRVAVFMAATARRYRAAFARAWAAGAFQPVVYVDGNGGEPAGGRLCSECAPGDDLQLAIDRCPPGGAILLQEGVHVHLPTLIVNRDVHLFGRGLAYLQPFADLGEADRATVDGLHIRNKSCGVNIEIGNLHHLCRLHGGVHHQQRQLCTGWQRPHVPRKWHHRVGYRSNRA